MMMDKVVVVVGVLLLISQLLFLKFLVCLTACCVLVRALVWDSQAQAQLAVADAGVGPNCSISSPVEQCDGCSSSGSSPNVQMHVLAAFLHVKMLWCVQGSGDSEKSAEITVQSLKGPRQVRFLGTWCGGED